MSAPSTPDGDSDDEVFQPLDGMREDDDTLPSREQWYTGEGNCPNRDDG